MNTPEHRRVRSYRREWARRLISRGNAPTAPPPRYGSEEWCNLPDSHPAKIAAVVLAAESWAWGNDVLAARDRVKNARHPVPGDAEELQGPLCWDWNHALHHDHPQDVSEADQAPHLRAVDGREGT
ncbi:hypothetical protein [Nocardiopsis valliformis]|uniref:hypothetical protein n=1 Tax=Nocardiopsis valliformis TaxID=239974 RepID=UPI0003462F6B|nr:hypothetical protein [Nocardiopsis valliformis]